MASAGIIRLTGAALASAGLMLAWPAQGKTSWQLVYNQPNQGNVLISVSATSPTHAWAVGVVQNMGSSQPVGLRTTDGVGWSQMTLPAGGGAMSFTIPTQLAFVDEQIGWMGGVFFEFPNEQPKLWRTDMGGMSWNEVFLPSAMLTDLQALPSGELFAVGGQILVRSLDGQSVEELPVAVPGGLELGGVHMLNPSCGYLTAASDEEAPSPQGAVLWSGDGGQSWESRSEGLAFRLTKAWFVSADLGWAAGADAQGGVIARTTDGGRSWSAATLPAHPPMFGGDPVAVSSCVDVRFFDDLRGLALCLACTGNCEPGSEEDPTYLTVFARSGDGGQSWEMDPDYEPLMNAPPFGELMKASGMFEMAFPDPNTGYLVGQNNLVLRYTADQPEPEAWGPASCEAGTGGSGAGNPSGGSGGTGNSGTGADAAGATDDEGGCGCRLARSSSSARGLLLGLLAGLAVARRRRR